MIACLRSLQDWQPLAQNFLLLNIKVATCCLGGLNAGGTLLSYLIKGEKTKYGGVLQDHKELCNHELFFSDVSSLNIFEADLTENLEELGRARDGELQVLSFDLLCDLH